jgi:prepilin-type N-terminal cleavage/methylation domain-containing protein
VKEPLQHLTDRKVRRGFTLLETLLVLGLLSMLAAVLIGGSASLLKGTARSDPEDALLALLQTIRRNAVEKGEVIELVALAPTDGDGPHYAWGEDHEETLPLLEGVAVKIIGPEVDGAILIGGRAQEEAVPRVRFYPDGTCDRVRLDITRSDARHTVPIDPLTCAPLPASVPK